MKICIYDKEYFKESKETQEAIISTVISVYNRIRGYTEQGIDFDHIFNDRVVKYQLHGNFYTYKHRTKNYQIRILYTYIEVDNEPTILVVDYFLKKTRSKKYMYKFDDMNNLNPMDLYNSSKVVHVA